MRAIRWGDNDRYLGPLTYAYEPRYRKVALELDSGDADDYPGCRIRLGLGAHTLILALPAIIKPWRKWNEITTEPTRSHMIAEGRKPGYWDSHRREYGFTFSEGSLHIHHGPQTHDSVTTKVKVWFYPWRDHRCVRHSVYDLTGLHFADLPQGRWSHNQWLATKALEDACPVAQFEFDDYDGERIIATCRIEEREWRRGRGLFRLLYIGRNRISRGLDLSFSSEVGRRKGSWKGGTVGHSIDMLPGELHEAAFRRYCEQESLAFVGPAQGIEAGTGETREAGLDAKHESAVGEADAPENPKDNS